MINDYITSLQSFSGDERHPINMTEILMIKQKPNPTPKNVTTQSTVPFIVRKFAKKNPNTAPDTIAFEPLFGRTRERDPWRKD